MTERQTMRQLIAQGMVFLPQPEPSLMQTSASLDMFWRDDQDQSNYHITLQSSARTSTSSDTFVSATEGNPTEEYSNSTSEEHTPSKDHSPYHSPDSAITYDTRQCYGSNATKRYAQAAIFDFSSLSHSCGHPADSFVSLDEANTAKLKAISHNGHGPVERVSLSADSDRASIPNVAKMQGLPANSGSSDINTAELVSTEHLLNESKCNYASHHLSHPKKSNANDYKSESESWPKSNIFTFIPANNIGSTLSTSQNPIPARLALSHFSNFHNGRYAFSGLQSIDEERNELYRPYKVPPKTLFVDNRRTESTTPGLGSLRQVHNLHSHSDMMLSTEERLLSARPRSVSYPSTSNFGRRDKGYKFFNVCPTQHCNTHTTNNQSHRLSSQSNKDSSKSQNCFLTPAPGCLSAALLSQPHFFSYNVAHPLTNCSLPTCQAPTLSSNSSTVFCPRCGALSHTRYCSKNHLHEDLRRHYVTECARRQNLLPVIDMTTVSPLMSLHRPFISTTSLQNDSIERHRQATYRSQPHTPTAEYHIFSDVDLLVADVPKDFVPTPETLAKYRGHGSVVATVDLTDDRLMKAQFGSTLDRMLMLGTVAGQVATGECRFLYGLIKEELIEKEAWDELMTERICLAMQLEFGWRVDQTLW